MTTLLADHKLGVMVADSQVSDGERKWGRSKKVWRLHNSLVGYAGSEAQFTEWLAWFRSGMKDKRRKLDDLTVLALRPEGLFIFDPHSDVPQPVVRGREAIGSGAMAAMCAYEATGFTDPRRAVQIVCRHDVSSEGPVRLYRL